MGTRDEAQMLRSPFGTMARGRWRGQGRLCVRHQASNGAGEWPWQPWGTQGLLWAWVALSLSPGREGLEQSCASHGIINVGGDL